MAGAIWFDLDGNAMEETESEAFNRESQEETDYLNSFLDPDDLWENDPENPANWGMTNEKDWH